MVQRDPIEIVIENPSFEAGGEPAPNAYPRPLAGWTFTGSPGVNFSPGDTFGDNGVTPDQSEVLFMWHESSASTSIDRLKVGQAYTLSYSVNGRLAPAGSVLTYDVTFGDLPLLRRQEVNSVGGRNPFLTQYLIFTNDAPSGTLTVTTYNEGDTSILLDNIRLVPGLRVPPQLVSASPTPGESVESPVALEYTNAQGSYPLDATRLKLLLNGVDVAAKSTVTAAGNPQGITVTYANCRTGRRRYNRD